jgi:hypothetical protein
MENNSNSIEAWVGHRAGLEVLEKRKISAPTRNQNPFP